jgi:hypothetical protein
MGWPKAKRGHEAKRSPAAALDAPDKVPRGRWHRSDLWAGLQAQFPHSPTGSCREVLRSTPTEPSWSSGDRRRRPSARFQIVGSAKSVTNMGTLALPTYATSESCPAGYETVKVGHPTSAPHLGVLDKGHTTAYRRLNRM